MKKLLEGNKKLMIIGVSTFLVICVGAIVITNLANKDNYNELVTNGENVGMNIDLGFIHSSKQIEEFASKVETKEYELNTSIESIKSNIQLDTDKFIETNQIDVTSMNLIEQEQLFINIAVLDDMSYIYSKQDIKPEKSNDKIKKYLEYIEIDKDDSNKLVIANVDGTEVTDELISDYMSGLDTNKAIDSKKLDTLLTLVLKSQIIEDLDNERLDVKKCVDEINKEVKAIKDKEKKEAAEKAKKEAEANAASTYSQSTSSSSSKSSNSSKSSGNSSSNSSSGGETTSTGRVCAYHSEAEAYAFAEAHVGLDGYTGGFGVYPCAENTWEIGWF